MNKRTELLLLTGILVAGSVALYLLHFKQSVVKPVSIQFRRPLPVAYSRKNFGQNRDPWSDVVFPITIAQALARSGSDFELHPDKRFLIALSLVTTFPHAPPGTLPDVKFKDGQWLIRAGDTALGTLPVYPDFSDAMQLLRTDARKTLGASSAPCTAQPVPEIAAQVTTFDDKSLIQALDELNHGFQAGMLQGTDLWSAAQAMSRLAYLDEDITSTTDQLSGKAMALVALAETACGKTMPKEESLLAAHMDYSRSAAQAVQELPKSDAWRLYFTKNDKQLEGFARRNPTSSEGNYFWLRWLGDHDLKKQWQSWYDRRYGDQIPAVYTLATVLPFSGFDGTTEFVQKLPQLMLPAMQGSYSPTLDQDDLTEAPAQVIKDFDAGAEHLQDTYKGPYLTANDVTTYYRGYLYSGLYRWALYLLDELDSIDDASAYRDLLKAAPNEIGKEMYKWVDVKLKFKQMGVPLGEIVNDMESSKALSPDVYVDVMEIASARTNWGSPPARQAARKLNSLLDTRPTFRQDYADVLKANMALPKYEDAERSLAAQENPYAPNFRIWQYYFDDDSGGLLRIAENVRLNRDTRLYALAYLRDTKGFEKGIRRAYADIIRENPGYGYACKSYLKYLAHIKDYADTEIAARRCLSSISADDTGFSRQNTIAELADAQLHQGKKDAAWKTISDILFEPQPKKQQVGPYKREIATYYGKVLGAGVRVAIARGDYGTAEFLAQTLVDRYPDAIDDYEPLLRVMWKERRYDDAAQFLSNWKFQLLYVNWMVTVGKPFAEVFDHNPTGARTAFLALVHARGKPDGIGSGPLVFIANAVGYYGNPGLAFDLKQLITLPETPGNFPDQLADYDFLKSAKGTSVAIRWLVQNTAAPTPQDMDRRISLIYTEGEMELLWSPIGDPQKVGDPDMLWLYRAAAYVQHYPMTRSEFAQLKHHFSKAGNSWHEYLGKYLMGQVDEQDMMNRKLDSQKLFEAIYYVALHQLSEGNYRQAEELLSVAMNTTKSGMWGFFSANLLGYWENAQSLSVLEKKGILFHAKDNAAGDQ